VHKRFASNVGEIDPCCWCCAVPQLIRGRKAVCTTSALRFGIAAWQKNKYYERAIIALILCHAKEE